MAEIKEILKRCQIASYIAYFRQFFIFLTYFFSQEQAQCRQSTNGFTKIADKTSPCQLGRGTSTPIDNNPFTNLSGYKNCK